MGPDLEAPRSPLSEPSSSLLLLGTIVLLLDIARLSSGSLRFFLPFAPTNLTCLKSTGILPRRTCSKRPSKARWSFLNHEPLTAGGTQLRLTYAVHSSSHLRPTVFSSTEVLGEHWVALVSLILFCVPVLEAFPAVKYRKAKPVTLQYQFSN